MFNKHRKMCLCHFFDAVCNFRESSCQSTLCPTDSWTEKPAFGTGLEEHLKRSNREIALPLEACVMMLLETGMKEEVRQERGRTAEGTGPDAKVKG